MGSNFPLSKNGGERLTLKFFAHGAHVPDLVIFPHPGLNAFVTFPFMFSATVPSLPKPQCCC